MTVHGCYGVRINETDKLFRCGKDSYPSGLGMSLIRELRGVIDRLGYDQTITLWRRQAERLIMTARKDDPFWPNSITHRLGIGYASNENAFITDGRNCEWAYILNLDDLVFEIYRGHQRSPHLRGRYSCDHQQLPFYPCALIACFSLHDLNNLMIEDEF